MGGNGFRIQRNIVTGFSAGFSVAGTGWTMVGNVATDNSGAGISLAVGGGQLGPPSRFEKNAMVGNGWGILVNVLGPPAITLTLERGNLFANGEADANCGVYLHLLDGDLTVNVDEYFWGAPGGPGPNPADAIGGFLCEDVPFGSTLTVNVTNVEPKPHTIKVPPQR